MTGERCASCGDTIKAWAWHYWLEEAKTTPVTICSNCMHARSGSRHLHAEFHPDCPERWHDLWDHDVTIVSSSGREAW